MGLGKVGKHNKTSQKQAESYIMLQTLEIFIHCLHFPYLESSLWKWLIKTKPLKWWHTAPSGAEAWNSKLWLKAACHRATAQNCCTDTAGRAQLLLPPSRGLCVHNSNHFTSICHVAKTSLDTATINEMSQHRARNLKQTVWRRWGQTVFCEIWTSLEFSAKHRRNIWYWKI